MGVINNIIDFEQYIDKTCDNAMINSEGTLPYGVCSNIYDYKGYKNYYKYLNGLFKKYEQEYFTYVWDVGVGDFVKVRSYLKSLRYGD